MKKPSVTLVPLFLATLFTAACSDLGSTQSELAKVPPPLPVTAVVASASVTPGQKLYDNNCAQCHDKSFYKAPSRMFISALSPQNLLKVMTTGRMTAQAAHLASEEREAIAEFLSGKKLSDAVTHIVPPSCDAQHSFDPSLVPVSIGWGVDLHNTRFQPLAAGGLNADNVGRLEVKWTFAYPGAYQARSEPVYGGGAVYAGSQDGTVWALDAVTGCLRWSFQAVTEVRTGIAISQWQADDSTIDPTLYFGDTMANIYALSAKTGALRWKIKADDHPYATATGTPTVTDGVVYVPVSSLEVIAPANPAYECCTFRGALLAVNGATGEQIWKAYTTDEAPKPVGKNAAGATVLAPSGAPIWSSPTIDKVSGRIYVATGENYSSPADGNSDSLLAYDLATGEKLWASQQTSNDAWNIACYISIPGISNIGCPEENGPDFDFGSHSILVTLDSGAKVLVGGQKSGDVVGVDPANGKTLWKTRVGRGGIQGGVHFGIAADGNTVYVPINDLEYPIDDVRYNYDRAPQPGIYAVNAQNGELLWSAPAPDVCGDTVYCDRGISQAVTAIPGAVIAGHLDGRLRIYSKHDGHVIWQMNMLRDYDSVSGETAKGGAFSGGGVLVAKGLLYVNAGYGYNSHIPGNALVVLGLAD
ncbi:MAG: polyvinyl alcohol dehydrogenase (cytochrome) [Paraglaciecola psychrophila]|jgi:polyvinyl alcohol dehydrogenase (cytochrome)